MNVTPSVPILVRWNYHFDVFTKLTLTLKEICTILKGTNVCETADDQEGQENGEEREDYICLPGMRI